MTRSLGQVPIQERAEIVSIIHQEAEEAGWHALSNQRKGEIYRDWERRFDLKHAAIKDQIMKGFDAAQHIVPKGEPAIHEKVRSLLEQSNVPFFNDKVSLWAGKAFADFVLGYSEQWITVAAELESAVNWQEGLLQALWYRAAYFQNSGLEVLAGLILFGSATPARWKEIRSTCTSMNVLLMTIDLRIGGEPEIEKSLLSLLTL